MKQNINVYLLLIDKGNHYVFQKRKTLYPTQGTNALVKVAGKASLRNPDRITSKNLHYLATMARVCNLRQNDQDILAITTEPHSTLELENVSKLLHALNSGTIRDSRGKTIDENRYK